MSLPVDNRGESQPSPGHLKWPSNGVLNLFKKDENVVCILEIQWYFTNTPGQCGIQKESS